MIWLYLEVHLTYLDSIPVELGSFQNRRHHRVLESLQIDPDTLINLKYNVWEKVVKLNGSHLVLGLPAGNRPCRFSEVSHSIHFHHPCWSTLILVRLPTKELFRSHDRMSSHVHFSYPSCTTERFEWSEKESWQYFQMDFSLSSSPTLPPRRCLNQKWHGLSHLWGSLGRRTSSRSAVSSTSVPESKCIWREERYCCSRTVNIESSLQSLLFSYLVTPTQHLPFAYIQLVPNTSVPRFEPRQLLHSCQLFDTQKHENSEANRIRNRCLDGKHIKNMKTARSTWELEVDWQKKDKEEFTRNRVTD